MDTDKLHDDLRIFIEECSSVKKLPEDEVVVLIIEIQNFLYKLFYEVDDSGSEVALLSIDDGSKPDILFDILSTILSMSQNRVKLFNSTYVSYTECLSFIDMLFKGIEENQEQLLEIYRKGEVAKDILEISLWSVMYLKMLYKEREM